MLRCKLLHHAAAKQYLTTSDSPNARWVLPVIVISQVACTSLWFAGNAVMADLQNEFDLPAQTLGHLTSAVQLGFISGTLVFAVLSIADRFSPSRVFFVSAMAGALVNLLFAFSSSLYTMLALRIATGIMLAGIYPVGMKIAADHFEKGLGKALGYLVGALVLGTAFPHLLKTISSAFDWRWVIIGTSVAAALGGVLMVAVVGDGPHRRRGAGLQLGNFIKVFKGKEFRSAAFGYFGHMWELYTFWAFVPIMITHHAQTNDPNVNVSQLSFVIIGIGALACVASGYLARNITSSRVATMALFVSGICCLASPIAFGLNTVWFVLFLMLWGVFVIADSPQFSTVVAYFAPKESTGTALTIVNCIGFSITIASIQLINYLATIWDLRLVFVILALGPLAGLVSFYRTASRAIV